MPPPPPHEKSLQRSQAYAEGGVITFRVWVYQQHSVCTHIKLNVSALSNINKCGNSSFEAISPPTVCTVRPIAAHWDENESSVGGAWSARKQRLHNDTMKPDTSLSFLRLRARTLFMLDTSSCWWLKLNFLLMLPVTISRIICPQPTTLRAGNNSQYAITVLYNFLSQTQS